MKPSPPFLTRGGPLIYPGRAHAQPSFSRTGYPPKHMGGVMKTPRKSRRGSQGQGTTGIMKFHYPEAATHVVNKPYQHNTSRSTGRRTSLPFYYFGAEISHEQPSSSNTSRQKVPKNKSSPRIYSDITTSKTVPKSMSTPKQSSQQTTCPCCSHAGSRLSGSPKSYPSPAGISAGLSKQSGKKSNGSSVSTSLQSLVHQGNTTDSNFPGTIIITPDNESYDDQLVWSHRYDPKKKQPSRN